MGLLAQHAYGKSDKINIGIEENLISGTILSPKAETPEGLKSFIKEMQSKNVELYMDPQFYMCAFEGDINIGKLDKYSFYPSVEINKKYLSIPSNLHDVVASNIEFQIEMGLSKLLSPNIFFESFDSRMSQIALSLANEAVNYHQNDLMLSLCINETAFNNFEDVKDFLDIISLFDVEGFYIIIERNVNENPNLIESEALCNILYFLYNLSSLNMYKVILGYADYIGVPLYVTGIDSIATGWYENTRKFDRQNFYPKTGMRRPRKRYYSNTLFNALLLNPEIELIQTNGKLGKVLSNTEYDHYMYNDLAGSQWSDSISCLSRWSSIRQILNSIDGFKDVNDKVDYMVQKLQEAQGIYMEIPEDLFDSKSKSTHIKSWIDGLNKFKEIIESM